VKRRFQRVTDYSDNEVAGFIQYSPNWPIKTRWGEIFVSLAGPLATILLGVIFLELDKNFGTRSVYFDVPKNIPKMYTNADGKIIQTLQHQAFLFLAIVCFLDALANLLPLKSDDKNTMPHITINKTMSPTKNGKSFDNSVGSHTTLNAAMF